ncbi:hypothetical protein RRG08_023895 [Elysia crispata]|uniref:Uncharacterized protein n=1 Tax=Elysia crispata TaxID=231223 RepID=A0AAE0ZZ56_9GAST|nr:hypothetical protein RRG08_023895 [Elysia crispata]
MPGASNSKPSAITESQPSTMCTKRKRDNPESYPLLNDCRKKRVFFKGDTRTAQSDQQHALEFEFFRGDYDLT